MTERERMSIAAAILWSLLMALASALAVLVVASQGRPDAAEPVPVVRDRDDSAIVYVWAVCPTCGESAPSVDGAVMCTNPECPAYGIAVETSK